MKLLYEAVRSMPAEWVDDRTQVAAIMGAIIVAVHPERPPMQYRDAATGWQPVEVIHADGVCPDCGLPDHVDEPKTMHPPHRTKQ